MKNFVRLFKRLLNKLFRWLCGETPIETPCSETPINLKPAKKKPDLTGFVIVRLSAQVPPTERDLAKLGRKQLPGLTRFLECHRKIKTRRLIRSVPPEKLLEMEKQAKASEFPPLHSLTSYWRLDLRGLKHPEELLRNLRELPEVDYAYLEKAAADPSTTFSNDNLASRQNYLDAAPIGIDARWASTKANGKGAGVGFIDLEQEWNFNHEDLSDKAPVLIFNENRKGANGFRGDHGTAVLGVVGGVDNKAGIVGAAPEVNPIRVASHYDAETDTDSHVADAIVAAIAVMAPGDVLLLETQRDFLPTETDSADFNAIRLAAGRGIIVIEAAGNGNTNLDALPAGASLYGDSGAIMVGSCDYALPHNRYVGLGRGYGSNYGSRINCFAWGENIVTTGYRDLDEGRRNTDNDDYSRSFGGTSGAAAIIAGAALIIQGMHKAARGGPLSPSQMRAILSEPRNGTPQGSDTQGNIGTMPNLRTILGTRLGLTTP